MQEVVHDAIADEIFMQSDDFEQEHKDDIIRCRLNLALENVQNIKDCLVMREFNQMEERLDRLVILLTTIRSYVDNGD